MPKQVIGAFGILKKAAAKVYITFFFLKIYFINL